MGIFNLRNAAVALIAGVGLSGCAYGPYGGLGVGVGYGNGYYDPYYSGYGYGSSYNPYGYGSYSPYGYGSYSPYGYGSYGSPWGWYDGFYYPGTGYYVYDRDRRPHRWTDSQRTFWERRREYFRTHRGTNTAAKPVMTTPQWGDFNRPVQNQTVRVREGGNDRARVRNVQRQERQAASDDDAQNQRRRGWRNRNRND